MGINNVKQGKLIYHLTKLSNLDSILEYGLLPRKTIVEKNIGFSDVANQEIISKRTELGLDIYTPFHFHPYSSFDVAVKNTYGNEVFIYICISRSDAEYNEFKILPRHPLNMEECKLMDYKEGFDNIDWDTMQSKGREDDYAKKVKMAECLTELAVPANVFQCIYVKDDETKNIVEKKLKDHGITDKPPYVDVMPWV
ncbi:DarT ssDNA thymidine ADP-ribosyltransferase family protein [Clostridium sp.]|uniref:DarT ssDNA thymidine ADP-ribosyltransferase family protein n=1 Tax=Clostridium sp. TaxID=1506 RepID=UPI0026033B83|nr:DarT ssDNA thymidine ADP-ribosyltransferase family protein [Clostridium sp.]